MRSNLVWLVLVSVTAIFQAAAFADEPRPSAQGVVANRSPLAPTPFIRLAPGSVRGEGWLGRQLELQKAGLTGSAETLYDALTPDSGWLGGAGENWEKAPYYVRGLLALAYALDDAELKQRARKWVDWALQSQRADGGFGPAANDDWWPRMVVLSYLRDFQEATGDARVVPFFSNYFQYQLKTLPTRPLKDWGKARAADNIEIVLWTYNRTGDPSLLELAKLLYAQAYPWQSIFADNRFYGFGQDFQPHHIVNVNQALKFPAVAWQFTGSAADKSAFASGLENLNRQYGRIDGQVSGTEMLSGLKSTDGVELCADIERIISDAIAVNAFGDATIADNLEKIAYNSLPAHTSPRMQQITYYQLLNQIAATRGGHGFHEDYDNGNVPGPHSGFPCCCYNWHTGWPKFVQTMWAATPDGGLGLIAYGPNEVKTSVAGNVPITITQTTDYPFGEAINLRVEPQHEVEFPLLLRLPKWCDNPSIALNGQPITGLQPGQFHRIDRAWKPGDVIAIRFPMRVRPSTWTQNSIGLERGPLAFALSVQEQWKSIHDYPGNFNEYEVTPQSAWNYALAVDRVAPQATVTTRTVSDVPWDTAAPPVTLALPARRLPGWGERPPHGILRFGKSNHGWQPITDSSAPLDPAEPHRLRVEAHGRHFQLFVDDIPQSLIDREDDGAAAGALGLRLFDTGATYSKIALNGKPLALDADALRTQWQAVSGGWHVEHGTLIGDKARDGKLILKTPQNLKDFTVEAVLRVAPGGDAGVIFRATDLTRDTDGYRGYYAGFATSAGQSHDAAEPPTSPVTSDQPIEQVQLIPFGSAKLRISYFPVLTP